MVADGDVVSVELFDLPDALVFVRLGQRLYGRTVETVGEVWGEGGEREEREERERERERDEEREERERERERERGERVRWMKNKVDESDATLSNAIDCCI